MSGVKRDRCCGCGRFLSLTDLNIVSDFTPDTEFTYERCDLWHGECWDEQERRLRELYGDRLLARGP